MQRSTAAANDWSAGGERDGAAHGAAHHAGRSAGVAQRLPATLPATLLRACVTGNLFFSNRSRQLKSS